MHERNTSVCNIIQNIIEIKEVHANFVIMLIFHEAFIN